MSDRENSSKEFKSDVIQIVVSVLGIGLALLSCALVFWDTLPFISHPTATVSETLPLTSALEETLTLVPTGTPTPTKTTIADYPAPVLVSPVSGANIIGEEIIQFSWQWECDLQEREGFDLRIWRSGEQRRSVAILQVSSFLLKTPPDGFGHYLWQVAVVRSDENGNELTLSESTVQSFVWDAAPTDTPTPSYTPADTSTPTAIATPTSTYTPTITPTPTLIPTPTPSLLSAPILLEPADDTDYCPTEAVWLKWQWAAGPFEPNEFYGIKVWKEDSDPSMWDRHWEEDPARTEFEVQLQPDERDVSPRKKYFQGSGRYFWNVVVLRDTGRDQQDEYGFWDNIGEDISEESETWSFIVRTNDDPACWP